MESREEASSGHVHGRVWYCPSEEYPGTSALISQSVDFLMLELMFSAGTSLIQLVITEISIS